MVPARTPSKKRLILPGSLLSRLAPRPKGESLANSTAASKLSYSISGMAGPKVSSRMIRMEWSTPRSTAGS